MTNEEARQPWPDIGRWCVGRRGFKFQPYTSFGTI